MLPTKQYKQEYDYAIEVVYDNRSGSADLASLESTLQRRASLGWRFVTAYTNELGKNSESYAGFGTNATIDQTILIFEKRIYNPELEALELLNREHRTAIDVLESNIIDPFVPKSATFITKGSETSVSATVSKHISNNLKGFQCDLTVYNVFGDKTVLEDICFFNFKSVNPMISVSDAFPVTLPDKISRGIESVGITVKRYMDDSGIHIPEQMELVNIRNSIIEKAGGFDKTAFLNEVVHMNSAGEITLRVRQLSNDTPGIFNEDIIQQLFKLYTLERSSGSNLKEDAIKRLTNFLNN